MNEQPRALYLADALQALPDCTCHAVHYYECGCDAIWPEMWVDHAAGELRRLHESRETLLKTLKEMLEQFTKTPSTLKDSEARIKAHAVIKAIEDNV